MLLRNNTGERREFPTLGNLAVEAGDSFEVSGDAAKRLLEQGFERVDTPARQKAAAARRKDNNDDAAAAETEES